MEKMSETVSTCKLCGHTAHLPRKCSVSIEIDRGCGECGCNGKRCRDGDGEWFPIDKTDEWESRRDSNSMAQPSPLRYVASITTNGTVTPQVSDTKIQELSPGTAQPWDGCLDESIEIGDAAPLKKRVASLERHCAALKTDIDAHAETLMQRDERIAALEAELAQAREELKVCDQIINTIEGLTGHNRARSDMRADGAVAEIVAERDSLRLQLERTQDQRNLLDNKLQGAEADARRLYEALRIIHQNVTNGRLCYFGDHTGYESQFSSEETVRWSAAIAAHEETK